MHDDDPWREDEYCDDCGCDPCLCDACPVCDGSGQVPTMDYESYLGAMYKPCYACGGTGER